jgi:4-hydroxy-2-oxoglutarate aldolase
VLIYNNPKVAAGVTVNPAVIKGVKDHPNVVGIKDSSKDTWKDNLEAGGDEIFSLAGSANYFLDLLSKGGTGGVLSLANIIPQACVDLYEAFASGNLDEAKKKNESLVSLNKQVSGKYSVAGVKAAMDLMGFTGGSPRRPLKPVTEEQRKDLEKTLKDFGYIK